MSEGTTGVLRVLFVGGLGRSGSTLVERLVGELPGVHGAGEVVHLWRRGLVAGESCGCGERFHDCPFWREVGDIAFGGWSQVDVRRVLALRNGLDRTRFIPLLTTPTGALRRRLEAYLQYYVRLYAAVRDVTGAAVVVDSSKHASLAYCLRWAADIDLRVLHVVRDSPAVAYSWTKRVRRPEADPATGEEYMATYRPGQAAMHWNVQNLSFDVLGRLGTPTQVLRYEDFVSAPGPELRRVAAFAGLRFDDKAFPVTGGDRVELSVTHSVSGNPMRFTAGEVRVRRDDAWRGRFPRRRRVVVSALTLPLRARYGYLGRGADSAVA